MFKRLKDGNHFLPSFIWQDWFVLAGGLTIFGGLAVATISKFSIWFDEAFGSYLIRYNFWDLTQYTAADVHPPLYYWLLKLWADLFGNTELGIRSMSIFFGLLTVVLAFLFVLRFFGRKAAYATLLFLVLSPMLIRYSQEARMYTLLTTIIVAATYVMVYATEHSKKKWPWVVYGVLVALGMLTQYLAAFAWVAHWIWRWLHVRSHGETSSKTLKKVMTREWVMAYIVAIALFAAWLPFMIKQFAVVQAAGFWIKPITTTTVPDFFTNYLLFTDYSGAQSWFAVGFYVIVGIISYLAYRLMRTLPKPQRTYFMLVLCMVIVPIVLLVLLSLPPLRPAFVDRYLIPATIFMSMVIGISLAVSDKVLTKWIRLAIGFVVAMMMCVGIYTQMTVGNYNKASGQSNNVRQLVEAVREKAAPGTPILANTPWIFYEAAIYSNADSPIYFANEMTEYRYGSLMALEQNDDNKIKDIDAFGRDNKTVWIIANTKDGAVNVPRSNWKEQESITLNDDLTGKPLYKAVRFSVE